MTTQPPVSVVIATRDRPEMLREAIAAIYSQDYLGRVEVLVVFDQSEPDLSLEHGGQDRSTSVMSNTRRVGLAGARNSGIERASGELVAFCDDDDYWLPDKLRRQVELANAHPEAGMFTCGITVEYDGEAHPRVLDQSAVSFEELLRDRHTELHPSTFMFRTQVLVSEIGLVDEQVPGGFGEDYDLLLRAARLHPIMNLREPGVVVRWGGQSFFFQRWETMAQGLTWILEHFPEFESSPRGSARLRGQVAFAHAAQGRRAEARSWAGQALRRSWREPRAYLALAVAARLTSPARVMQTLHRYGRGI